MFLLSFLRRRGEAEGQGQGEEQYRETGRLLAAFGNDTGNIPEVGVGNCQDWVAGAVGMLERTSTTASAGGGGIVKPGKGAFWTSMTGKSAENMCDACLWTGKEWIPGPGSTFEGVLDARFVDREVRRVGRSCWVGQGSIESGFWFMVFGCLCSILVI